MFEIFWGGGEEKKNTFIIVEHLVISERTRTSAHFRFLLLYSLIRVKV